MSCIWWHNVGLAGCLFHQWIIPRVVTGTSKGNIGMYSEVCHSLLCVIRPSHTPHVAAGSWLIGSGESHPIWEWDLFRPQQLDGIEKDTEANCITHPPWSELTCSAHSKFTVLRGNTSKGLKTNENPRRPRTNLFIHTSSEDHMTTACLLSDVRIVLVILASNLLRFAAVYHKHMTCYIFHTHGLACKIPYAFTAVDVQLSKPASPCVFFSLNVLGW